VNTTDPHWKENASVGCGFGNTFSPWMATDDSMGGTFYGSYGFNSKGCTVGYTPGVTVSVRGATASSHLYRVGRSRTPVLLDAPWWWATGGGPPPTHGGDSDMTEGVSFCMNRHDEATNSLFLDWSVRRVGLKELWTLRWWSTFDVAGPWTKAGGVQPKDWPEWMRGFREY
jgi:prepilin-type processing-associated H-X9-DG protein